MSFLTPRSSLQSPDPWEPAPSALPCSLGAGAGPASTPGRVWGHKTDAGACRAGWGGCNPPYLGSRQQLLQPWLLLGTALLCAGASLPPVHRAVHSGKCSPFLRVGRRGLGTTTPRRPCTHQPGVPCGAVPGACWEL